MNRRIAVRGIALLDGKLLCVKLKPYNGKIKIDGYWCLPGGGLDPQESLIDGIKREMLEETGVPAQIGNLLYVQQFMYEGTEFMEFFFHITNAQDYTHIDLTKSTHGMEEIAAVDFIEPAGAQLLPTFLATEDLIAQVATPQPPKLFSFVT
jgi:8-oxo-dGTP diphosphatase